MIKPKIPRQREEEKKLLAYFRSTAQEKDLLSQKTQDQDTALLNLAKQKIEGKKEAKKLLKEWEDKWKEEKKLLAYFRSTAQEIEKIIGSKLILFVGKEKTLNYLKVITKDSVSV